MHACADEESHAADLAVVIDVAADVPDLAPIHDILHLAMRPARAGCSKG